MNVSDVMVLKSPPSGAAYSPRAKGGAVFVAVMQGEVMLIMAGAATVLLSACSVWHGPAARVVSLSASDDTVGITWTVDSEIVGSETQSMPQPMDELTAIVLQDAAFEAPGHPVTTVAGASCSRSGALEAALVYLSCRLQGDDSQDKCGAVMPAAADTWVNRARQFMHASLDAPLTLADLADRLGCSPATLVRAFKADGLPSPIRYFADLRVNHAKASLQQSELSISNIAASLGFRDLATFSHFFRKHTGHSPRDYRLNCRWLL